jgi:hypothetical protein
MLLSIIFNAIGDGLRIRDYKTHTTLQGILYHVFGILSILVVFSIIFVPKAESLTILQGILCLISYACLRFGIFDFILNIVAGKHWLYLGDTAGIDKLLKKIFNTPTKLGILSVLRIISLMGGMAIIQYL